MSQLDLHMRTPNQTQKSPPLRKAGGDSDVIVLGKFKTAYKTWHGYLVHLPKLTRHTLGARIDTLFTDCLALTLKAKYQPRQEKVETIEELSATFDFLKFFMELLWEVGGLEEKQFLILSEHLHEIGKMIGGWRNLWKNNSSEERPEEYG